MFSISFVLYFVVVYLQLPEPLLLFRHYNDVIGLAKESQSIIVEELEALRLSPGAVKTDQVSVELNRVLFKIKDLLRQLPPANYKTLQFLIEHLRRYRGHPSVKTKRFRLDLCKQEKILGLLSLFRVTERSEENKMTASNLGIIFGPTLIKPRQADTDISLSSLVDYPYQALTVELLIRHYQMLFDTPLSPLSGTSPSDVDIHPRLTQQEKERQLNRHSKSLGDIKEVTSG